MEVENEKCFVIMPIGDTEGYEKGHFKKVYEDLLKPAIKEAGYLPERADEIQSTSLITVDIIDRIYNTPISICDISSCNPNVFYELGIRNTCMLPVVLIKDKKTNNPFDIKDIRHTEYSESLEYEDVIKKREKIKDAITQTIDDYKRGINRNSLISLIKPVSDSNSKVQLCSNFSFLEKEAERISTLIDKDYSVTGRDVALLINRFEKMCSNYSGGAKFYEYLKAKFLHKYPGDYSKFLLFCPRC